MIDGLSVALSIVISLFVIVGVLNMVVFRDKKIRQMMESVLILLSVVIGTLIVLIVALSVLF